MAKYILSAIVLATLIVGCDRHLSSFELDEKSFDAEAYKMVEDNTGLTLPEGRRGLNFRYKPPVDPAFFAKLSIPVSSKDAIVKQIQNAQGRNFTGNISDRPKPPWWLKGNETIVTEREYVGAGGMYVHVTVVQTNEQLVMYINHFLMN